MELAQCLNFTKAAVNLYIAQPALSQQIAELEKQLGVTLFTRNSRSVALTPAGKILMEACPDILGRMEKAHKRLLQAQAGIRGSLRIGYLDMFRQMLPGLMKTFSQMYPDVALELFDGSMKDQRAALAGDQIDVAFTFINPYMVDVNSPPGCNVLWRDDLCLLVPESHPFALEGGGDYALLEQETMLLLDDDVSPYYSRLVQDSCDQVGLKLLRCRTGRSVSSVIMQAEAGLGIALLPRCAADQAGGSLKVFPVRKNCMEFGVVWNPASDNASLPLLLDLIEKAWDAVPGK